MPREKKTEIITLRVAPRTKAVIQARAKSVNKTVTDCLCLCGLGKEIVQVEGLDKVLSELKAQGRNLNQLTSADSDDNEAPKEIGTIDPVDQLAEVNAEGAR